MPTYPPSGSERRQEPAEDIVPVTPDNDNDLPGGTCRAIRVTATGDLAGTTAAGNDRTITLYTQGEIIPVGDKRIKATGTTGSVEALY